MIELRDLFDIKYGSQLDLNKQEIAANSGINFVNRSASNLGISCKIAQIDDTPPFAPGLISVSLGGSILASFVQPEAFYTGQNVKVLTPKYKLSYNQKIFYCLCIKHNAYRYGAFGREANKTLDYIRVPAIEDIPDHFNSIVVKPPSKKAAAKSKPNLDKKKWQKFSYGEIFNIHGTKTTSIEELSDFGKGRFPYVTTQAVNNGVEGFFDHKTEAGNVLCIDSAVVGFCSYQESDFTASDHVEKLELRSYSLNKHVAMFLATIINKEQYRYSYGRKRSQARLRGEYIKLPVDSQGEPDWQFMENYIKSLLYSNNL